jgi:SAM-dependent methyltransferase
LLEQLVRGSQGTEGASVTVRAGSQATAANRIADAAPVQSMPSREPPAQAGLSLTFGSAPDDVKQGYQRFYDAVSTQLDSTVFGEFAFFLNYGYAPNLSPQFSQVKLPDHFINKNSVRLVLEVIGDCALNGRRVLDVGCGRGGTVYVVHSFFKPAEITGLDLSAAAVAFCRKAHRYAGVRFEQGDAERLPLADHSFDVITNVESSHSYPNINAFYAEVHRVLAPGGYFLYTDVLSVDDWRDKVASLQRLGFVVEREQDVTANVLLSCDDVAQSRVQAFDSGNDPHLMRNFLATPGSEVYVEMSKRRWKYNLLKLRKPS